MRGLRRARSSEVALRKWHKYAAALTGVALFASLGLQVLFEGPTPAVAATVPGENYEICDQTAQYLTSPWTYDAVASGTQTETVAQYEALTGYGTTLPPLPAYISDQPSSTTAAIIFAPGSTVTGPAYDYPATPIIYFFEGGSYSTLGFQSVNGDEFIGGSATGFSEPIFNDGGTAAGIDAQNGTTDFSGGASTLAAQANSGTTAITTTSAIPGYIQYVTFSDGSTYQLSGATGTSLTLASPLAATEAAGSAVWANVDLPIAEVASSGSQGAASLTISASSVPLMQYASVVIGAEAYTLTSVSGSQSGYTLGVGSLDMNVAAGTPIYYGGLAGDVTVDYLNINDDQHNTTGTIYTGSGWTIEHNNIHDGYSTPGMGVAMYGGDQGTIEYNCMSKMGDYGVNIFGTNNLFDYNEVYESNYEPDPGCGCSGGGKWWGTLNADIVDNAFINDSPGGGGPVWLDNGNSGTLISGNYFDQSYGTAIASETGFNVDITNNLFLNGGWGDGTGACGGSNCDGAVNINSSGGFNVPGSRYENEVLVQNNQFINNWMGIDVWQAGARTCENSGEGYPDDAAYCSGGYPNSEHAAAGGQYYFSHIGDSLHGGTTSVAANATSGSSTIIVQNAEAIHDQIGFADPLSSTTTDTTDVSTFTGSGTINATTTGFPVTGELRVATSAAWTDGRGSWTGAILSYNGITGGFQNVTRVSGSGTLSGTILQVQPYEVQSETCYVNDCALQISPALSAPIAAGATVTNAGTCQLFADSTALPSGPSINGVSYWDGCQWESKDISVTGNTFIFQPSQIAASAPLTGGGTTTVCTAANTNFCGTNFMAFQTSGEAPFDSPIGANAMMSSSSFTGCPSWDSGCTTDPLANLNANATTPGVPAGNDEAPDNNVWANNTISGPWAWTSYIFGSCYLQPTDPNTGKSMPAGACSPTTPQWQSVWQQDQGTTVNPMLVTLNGLAAGQEIHGATQPVSAFEDTNSSNSISSTISVNGAGAGTLTSSPFNFTLNTLSYPDGPYNIKIAGTDNQANTNSDQAAVYISNGDLNGDGSVNLSDLAVMAGNWGKTDPNYADGNITGQSTINLSDLAVLAANWGWSK